MLSLTDIRSEYARGTLDENTVAKDPIKQFENWISEAIKAKVAEPSAMNLATVTGTGLPSSRIVLLKGIEKGCFVFFTNYQSRKGAELEDQNACALNFFWPELERQVNIQGVASRVSEESSIAYFQSRPRESQIGAWASPQSAVLSSRKILDDRLAEIEKKFKGQSTLPKPRQWGGFQVLPHWIEFWQGRPSRLHDRILYTRIEQDWKIVRLAP